MAEIPIIIETSVMICIDLQSKSVDWFLNDRDLRHERVKEELKNLSEISKSGRLDESASILKTM